MINSLNPGGVMCFQEFFIAELEKQLEGIELLETKIEFISDEILKCEKVIQELQFESGATCSQEIKFAIKQNGCHNSLIELLNRDSDIRSAVTQRIFTTCKEKLCERNIHFLERAKSLKDNLLTKFDLQIKSISFHSYDEEMKNNGNGKERIVWYLGKDKLLEMFVYLNKNEILPKYSTEEILVHFSDEKQNPFCRGFNHFRKIQWHDSDSSFSIFVDELAKRGAINDGNKYKIFEKHFKNKVGKTFKYLPQKKNYTKNCTTSGNLIVSILDTINLSVAIFICALVSLENVLQVLQ